MLEGKSVSGIFHDGQVSALSSTGARIHTDADVRELADLRIELADDDGAEVVFYGKVVDRGTDAETVLTVRFSARSLALDPSGAQIGSRTSPTTPRGLPHDSIARRHRPARRHVGPGRSLRAVRAAAA